MEEPFDEREANLADLNEGVETAGSCVAIRERG